MVISMACDGLTNREIAELHGKSLRTVEEQRRQAYKKIGASNTVDMVIWAMQHGIMPIPELLYD